MSDILRDPDRLRFAAESPDEWVFEDEDEQFAEAPPPPVVVAAPPRPARSGEVALAGADGAKAADLLRRAKRQGTAALSVAAAGALDRLLSQGGPRAVLAADRLLDGAGLDAAAAALAATNATAELLGRLRVRRRQRAVEGGQRVYADQATDYGEQFAEGDGPPLMTPNDALEYFLSLEPRLGVDPERFGVRQERRAFTLAVSTDEVLLRKVKGVIARNLETGEGSAADIDAILDAAGVGPRRVGYGEMVMRTNLMDAYQVGSERERMLPELLDVFPAWRYLGILDGREGDDHRPNFDRYFPAAVSFQQVRGPRVYNCRCASAPVAEFEWAELRGRGVRLARG